MSWIGLVVNIATDATGPPTRSPCPAPHSSWGAAGTRCSGSSRRRSNPREAAPRTSTAGRTAAQTRAAAPGRRRAAGIQIVNRAEPDWFHPRACSAASRTNRPSRSTGSRPAARMLPRISSSAVRLGPSVPGSDATTPSISSAPTMSPLRQLRSVQGPIHLNGRYVQHHPCQRDPLDVVVPVVGVVTDSRRGSGANAWNPPTSSLSAFAARTTAGDPPAPSPPSAATRATRRFVPREPGRVCEEIDRQFGDPIQPCLAQLCIHIRCAELFQVRQRAPEQRRVPARRRIAAVAATAAASDAGRPVSRNSPAVTPWQEASPAPHRRALRTRGRRSCPCRDAAA